MEERVHRFVALAFVENFVLRDIAGSWAGSRASPYEVRTALGDRSEAFAYAFGVVVFHDVEEAQQAAVIQRLGGAVPALGAPAVRETFEVRESEQAGIRVDQGLLRVDRLGPDRAGVIALIVAQSAAMEYYETLVERLNERTRDLVGGLESRGTVSARTGPLHRFIGNAVGTRSEVLMVLHLLDKPDAVWDDPALDRIYGDLRAEFDLVDRYQAVEAKLRSIQEALELVLGVARERRLVLLEAAVVVLILIELLLGVVRLL